MGESTPWVQNNGKALRLPPALGGRQGQPAGRNPPAGSRPPPADDIQSVALAPASQNSKDAVPFAHWGGKKNKKKNNNTGTQKQKGKAKLRESRTMFNGEK